MLVLYHVIQKRLKRRLLAVLVPETVNSQNHSVTWVVARASRKANVHSLGYCTVDPENKKPTIVLPWVVAPSFPQWFAYFLGSRGNGPETSIQRVKKLINLYSCVLAQILPKTYGPKFGVPMFLVHPYVEL